MALLKNIIHDYKVNGNTEALADLFENEKVKKLINDISRWYKYNKQDVVSVIKVHIIDYLKNSYEYNDQFNEKIFLDTMKFKVSYATKKEVSRTQKSKELPFGDMEQYEDIVDLLAITEERVDLLNGLKMLKENEQKVLCLYYIDGLKEREICDILGISQSRVNQIKARAIKKLKTYFG